MSKIRNIILIATLLMVAITACSKSPETARKELGQMNIDYTDDSFFNYVERGDKVVVELFLTAGKSPNLRERDSGYSVLMSAAFKGHDEIVKLLIAKGADVNAKVDKGFTALMLSLVKYPDVAKTLIKKGADVNAAITEGEGAGRTVLMMATQYSNKEIVEMLLDKGANVNAEAYDTQLKGPRTALTEAILRGDLEITKALLDKGAKVKATDLALSCQKVEILKTLLPHVKDKSDLNVVLSIAKKFSLLEAVDILEKAGAKE